jgi:hypothetical protein
MVIFHSYVSLPEGTYFTVAYTFTFRKTDVQREDWARVRVAQSNGKSGFKSLGIHGESKQPSKLKSYFH